jgi:hypothetical protein
MTERDREHEHGDFAKGEEHDEEHVDHTGSFAEGQQDETHEHGEPIGGDFAKGEEHSEEHEKHEGDFAEGQEDESKHEH